MPITQPTSPLDRISNLKPFSPEAVEAFENRMRSVVIPEILESQRRQAQAAAEMRNKLFF